MKERLKELRKALGLRQREVAERLGVTVGVVGGWECGRDNIPDARIRLLCKEFRVRRDWLEKGEGEMFEPDAPPRTLEEILKEAACAIYERLDLKGKAAVDKVLDDLIAKNQKNQTVKNQTNYGRVDGDMIQN